MSKLDAALALAAYGVKVHPVSPETKAPLTKHGHLDGSTNPEAIRAWWAMWPDAWPGMNLAASGLVTVAPDSPEWLTTFEERGLETPARWQSPGGAGHVHAVFRRSANCPTTRICRSGEYDVMSDGYSIAYLSDATSVPNMNGGLPETPAWVVDMLRAHAAEKAQKGTKQAAPSTDTADEPPIELDDRALAVWAGEVVKQKPDGTIDRSATLMKIGRVLYDAGMTRRGVVTELEDRDHALGFHKFCCDRTDRETRYQAIFDELETKGRNASGNLVTHGDTPASMAGQNGSGSNDSEADETAESRGPCQRPECRQAKRNLRAVVKAIGNEGLTAAERIAGVVTAMYVVESRQQNKADDAGTVATFVPNVAGHAGLPERTYSRTLKSLEAYGWADRQYKDVKAYDRVTRQPTNRTVTQLRVSVPGETIADALAPLALLKPERVRAGGAKPRQCMKHPEADVYKTVTYHCAVCDEVLVRELDVDAETGEVFGYGHTPPEPVTMARQNGSPSETPDQPPLFTEPTGDGDTMARQNGSLPHRSKDSQNGGPSPAASAPPEGRCAKCHTGKPNPYQRLCQKCVLANIKQADRNKPRRKRGAA